MKLQMELLKNVFLKMILKKLVSCWMDTTYTEQAHALG